jgi:hypothetical protein
MPAPATTLTNVAALQRMREAPALIGAEARSAPSLPLMTAAPLGTHGMAPPAGGPAACAFELARPFLKLVEGSIASDVPRSSAPRFWELPQPLVTAVPSNDSASRMVEAVRSQPATPSDDRVSLADLTLIAIASATRQVAASPAGGGPSGSGGVSSPAAAPAATPIGAGHGGGGRSGSPQQEIEEIARAAFAELQRLIEVARERSGHHG